MQPCNELTFEQAMKELEKVIDGLDDPNMPLDNILEQYERGVALSRHCASLLKNAKSRIAVLANENGTLREIEWEEEEC